MSRTSMMARRVVKLPTIIGERRIPSSISTALLVKSEQTSSRFPGPVVLKMRIRTVGMP